MSLLYAIYFTAFASITTPPTANAAQAHHGIENGVEQFPFASST
jgi:hypothetical protein